MKDYSANLSEAEVRKFYNELLTDTCETDTHVREAARPFLTVLEIDGDSYGVPAIEDIVDLLCNKLRVP